MRLFDLVLFHRCDLLRWLYQLDMALRDLRPLTHHRLTAGYLYVRKWTSGMELVLTLLLMGLFQLYFADVLDRFA